MRDRRLSISNDSNLSPKRQEAEKKKTVVNALHMPLTSPHRLSEREDVMLMQFEAPASSPVLCRSQKKVKGRPLVHPRH
jgi:hypothetical protein